MSRGASQALATELRRVLESFMDESMEPVDLMKSFGEFEDILKGRDEDRWGKAGSWLGHQICAAASRAAAFESAAVRREAQICQAYGLAVDHEVKLQLRLSELERAALAAIGVLRSSGRKVELATAELELGLARSPRGYFIFSLEELIERLESLRAGKEALSDVFLPDLDTLLSRLKEQKEHAASGPVASSGGQAPELRLQLPKIYGDGLDEDSQELMRFFRNIAATIVSPAVQRPRSCPASSRPERGTRTTPALTALEEASSPRGAPVIDNWAASPKEAKLGKLAKHHVRESIVKVLSGSPRMVEPRRVHGGQNGKGRNNAGETGDAFSSSAMRTLPYRSNRASFLSAVPEGETLKDSDSGASGRSKELQQQLPQMEPQRSTTTPTEPLQPVEPYIIEKKESAAAQFRRLRRSKTDASSSMAMHQIGHQPRVWMDVLDGTWVTQSGTVALIHKDSVTWPEGMPTIITHKTADRITAEIEGESYHAKLLDGKLVWDDGDQWTRARKTSIVHANEEEGGAMVVRASSAASTESPNQEDLQLTISLDTQERHVLKRRVMELEKLLASANARTENQTWKQVSLKLQVDELQSRVREVEGRGSVIGTMG